MEMSGEERESAVSSLCSFTNCDEDVAKSFLQKFDWSFEEACIALYEHIKRKKSSSTPRSIMVRSKNFTTTKKTLFWVEVLFPKKINDKVEISFGEDQKIQLSREHLFSIWLQSDNLNECKIFVEMNDHKEGILLKLPQDYTEETTHEIAFGSVEMITKLRRSRRSLSKGVGCIYDLLCCNVGSIKCKARESKSSSSSNHERPWKGTDVSHLFDDFKISKSNNNVPLDVLATTSESEEGESWTCFAMLRESAILSLLNREPVKGVGSAKQIIRSKTIPLLTEVLENVVLSSEEFEAFSEKQLKNLAKQRDNDFVRCPNAKCGAMIERVSNNTKQDKMRAPPSTATTRNGIIDGDALRHFNEYRMRCLDCNITFCMKCGITPYHVGKTCKQNVTESKNDSNNNNSSSNTEPSQCRFCESKLKSSSSEVVIKTTRTLKDVQAELKDAMKRMDRAAISRLMLERAQMQQSGVTSQKVPAPAPKVYKDDMSIMRLDGNGQFVHIEEEKEQRISDTDSIYNAFTFETWIKPQFLKKFSLDEAEDEEQVDSIMDANAQLESMYRDRGVSVVFSKGALFWNEINPPPEKDDDDEKNKKDDNKFDDSPPPVPGMCVLYDPMTRKILARIVSVTFTDGSLPKVSVTEVCAVLKDVEEKREKWYHIACTFSQHTRMLMLYVNGEIVSSSRTHKGPIGPRCLLDKMCITLGGTYAGHCFAGEMSETRIWSCERSPEELNRFAHVRVQGPSSKIYGIWPMSYLPDVSGKFSLHVEDRSGEMRHGIVVSTGHSARLKVEPRVDTTLCGTSGKRWKEEHVEFLSFTGKDVKLSSDRRSAVKMKKNWNTGSAMIGPSVSSGIVRWRWLVQQGSKITLGIVLSTFDPHRDGYINKSDLGYAYYQENGKSGHAGPARASYGRDWKDPSCIIDVVLDCDQGTLSFCRNGVSQGVAFSDLPKKKAFMGGVSLYNAGDSVRLLSFERLQPRRTPCPMKMISRVWKGKTKKQAESYYRCSRGALLTKECYVLRLLLRYIGGIAFMYLDGFLARGVHSIRKLRKVVKEIDSLQEMGLRRAHARIIERIVQNKKKNLEQTFMNQEHIKCRVNVWQLCDEAPLYADAENKTALQRQNESLRRLGEFLEKQRISDLEKKRVEREKSIAQEKTLCQLTRMGFSRDSCKKALNAAGPNIETAAIWLVKNVVDDKTSSYTNTSVDDNEEGNNMKKRRRKKKSVRIDDKTVSWRCSRCTFLNKSFHKRCAICDMSSSSRQRQEEEGNEIASSWICGICRFQNRAAADCCEFCCASRKIYFEDISTRSTTTTTKERDVVLIEDEDGRDETKEDTNKILTLRCPDVVSTLSVCCDKSECLGRRMNSCLKRLECGHLCGGIRGEFAPSNSKSCILGDVVDAGFDVNLSSGNLEISNKGLHVSASPGNGSKLAVLNRNFEYGRVTWKMVLAPGGREMQMLLGCVSMLGPEDYAATPFYSYDAYRLNAERSDCFFYQPSTGALFERGVELPVRVETSGPGNEIKFELDLRSRTMTLSINSRIQGVTFSDISASVRPCVLFENNAEAHTQQAVWIESVKWDGAVPTSDQSSCLPCLKCNLKVADDFCAICYSEALCAAPCVQLTCGHTFHYHCVKKHIENGYAHHRIKFEHTRCPLCKEKIQHWAFNNVLSKWALLEDEVNDMALNRLRIEGNEKHREILEPWGQFYQKPLAFAQHIYVFYQCYKCQKPYFAGNQICGAADDEEDDEDDEEIAKQLLCSSCGTHNIEACPRHGKDWIQYKCRFCCRVASFHCWGNTHFCKECHKPGVWKSLVKYKTGKNLKKIPTGKNLMKSGKGYGKNSTCEEYFMCPARISNDPKDCPLRLDHLHAPNGKEFSLGCILCRDEKQKEHDDAQRELDKKHEDILLLLHRISYGNIRDPFARPRGRKLLEVFIHFHLTEGEKLAQSKVLKRIDMVAFLLRCAPKDWLKNHNLDFKDLEEQRQLTGIMNVGTRRKERKRITALYLSFIRTYSDQAEGAPSLRVRRHLDGEEVPGFVVQEDGENSENSGGDAKENDVGEDDDGAAAE